MSINHEDQNYFIEKNYLVWTYNPLFLFFQQFKPKSFEYFVIHMQPNIEKIESPIWDSYHKNFPKQLNKIEDFWRENFDFDLNSYSNPFVISLTYIFSLYIATNSGLRLDFYNSYYGRIPAITQYLLNTIRLGPLDNNYYVNAIDLNPSYESILMGGNSDALRFINEEEMSSIYNFSKILNWFDQLELFFADKNMFFRHFVPLQTTPLLSTEKLTLTGFNQHNPQFLKLNSQNKKSLNRQEENLLLINKSVNAILSDTKKTNYLDSFSFTLLGSETSTIKTEEQIYEFTVKVIDFIINCSANDLDVKNNH